MAESGIKNKIQMILESYSIVMPNMKAMACCTCKHIVLYTNDLEDKCNSCMHNYCNECVNSIKLTPFKKRKDEILNMKE